MMMRRARMVWLCNVAALATACATSEDTDEAIDEVADADNQGDGDADGDRDGGAGGDGDGDGDGVGDGDGDGPTAADCSGDAPEELDDLVTSFEDGTVGVNPVEGRGGGFYIFNDKDNDTTAQTFEVEAMNRCADGSSLYSFCSKGSGFTVWGAGFGTDLGVVDPDTMAKTAVDLSAYSGISFWLMANPGSAAPVVKVMLPDLNTAAEGENCTNDAAAEATEKCDPFVKNVPVANQWTHVVVKFDDLRHGGWGKAVPAFGKEGVYGIQLQFAAGADFDVCFDQLVLVR